VILRSTGISQVSFKFIDMLIEWNSCWRFECFCETGRIMEAPDRPHIDKIAADVEAKGVGLRDLVMAVVTSEIFLSK
jgi:hypothetical protein